MGEFFYCDYYTHSSYALFCGRIIKHHKLSPLLILFLSLRSGFIEKGLIAIKNRLSAVSFCLQFSGLGDELILMSKHIHHRVNISLAEVCEGWHGM